MSVADCELDDVAIEHLPVHRIWRACQAGVDEGDDLSIELCDERDGLASAVRLMLASLAVARRYLCAVGNPKAFSLEPSVIFGALDVDASDALGVLRNSRTDCNHH